VFDMRMSAELPLYKFDEADAELSLLPMAARRALDCAGLHLSLQGWQRLPRVDREAVVRAGAAEKVDVQAVAQLLAACGADIRPMPPLTEADSQAGPDATLLAALPGAHALSRERWCQLSALDRYVLAQLSRRGKRERLAIAYAEICG
jgi:hypothetical protein